MNIGIQVGDVCFCSLALVKRTFATHMHSFNVVFDCALNKVKWVLRRVLDLKESLIAFVILCTSTDIFID